MKIVEKLLNLFELLDDFPAHCSSLTFISGLFEATKAMNLMP
jgi:hypothetical protein